MTKLSKKNPFGSEAVIADDSQFSSINSIEINGLGAKAAVKHEEEYEPFEHRKVENPNSDLRSFANLLKSSLGSGILSMPAAFKNSGSVLGLCGTIVLGYLCVHCVQMLVDTSQKVCKIAKKPSLGYAETFEAVLETGPRKLRPYGSNSRLFVDISLASLYLGACGVYVVLVAESIKQIVDHFHAGPVLSTSIYCVMLLPFLIGFAQIKTLKYLAPFSALANALLIATFAICLYYIFDNFPDFGSRRYVQHDVTKLPLFISTVVYAMEGIGVVLPVENTMKKPKHFLGCPGVLNVTMSLVIILYSIMGILGYIKYGDSVQGTITLNLPVDDPAALVAKCFIILAIFFTYILQFYVPIEIIWRNLKSSVPVRYSSITLIGIRTFLVILTVAVAASLPRLEEIIGLVGALFYSLLGFIVPATMDIIFNWERGLGAFKWRLWKNLLLITFGTFLLIAGCTQSIKEFLK